MFFDEAGVDSNIQQEYALAESKERAYFKRSNGRRKRTGLIAGIGKEGLKAPFRFHGNVNGEILEKYFREHLVKELKAGQIVVLDNASYHKRVGIKKAVEEAGCELLFLPTYSPDLNPIEQVWSQMKRLIKKLIRDGKDCLVEAIDEAFIKICDFDFSNYFTHFSKLVNLSF